MGVEATGWAGGEWGLMSCLRSPQFVKGHLSISHNLVAVALSDMADWEKNFGQLLAENYDLRRMVSQKQAELNATEAHYTTMAQALADANSQLARMSKKEAVRMKKVKAKRVSGITRIAGYLQKLKKRRIGRNKNGRTP